MAWGGAWQAARGPRKVSIAAVLAVIVAATPWSGGCTALAPTGQESEILRITGELTYLPRVALPPDSIAVVELRDGPDPDDPVVAEQRIALKGRQVPIPFELTVDAALLAHQPDYAFRGGIVHRGEPIWLTETLPVDTGAGRVALGTLRMTTHRSGSAPGGDAGALVAPVPDALADGEWRVVEIDGEATAHDARPTLRFEAGGRISGNGSCNRYSGPFRVEGEQLRFGDLASTMMACDPPRIDQERRLFEVLREVERYRAEDDTLVLETADGRTLRAQRRR